MEFIIFAFGLAVFIILGAVIYNFVFLPCYKQHQAYKMEKQRVLNAMQAHVEEIKRKRLLEQEENESKLRMATQKKSLTNVYQYRDRDFQQFQQQLIPSQSERLLQKEDRLNNKAVVRWNEETCQWESVSLADLIRRHK